MPADLPPLHEHHGHFGFRGQLRERSLQAAGVVCRTKAKRGAGSAPPARPPREVRGRGGASVCRTMRPGAARAPRAAPRPHAVPALAPDSRTPARWPQRPEPAPGGSAGGGGRRAVMPAASREQALRTRLSAPRTPASPLPQTPPTVSCL